MTLSNTTQRILSTIIMVLILGTVIYIGKFGVILFAALLGCLVIGEIFFRFFKLKQMSFSFWTTFGLFFLCLMIMVKLLPNINFVKTINMIGLLSGILCIFYLFSTKWDNFPILIKQKTPFIISILVSIPLISFLSILNYDRWHYLAINLILITFAMDTGAWLVGRFLGKRKLFPKVSPKKTIEGLFGGLFCAGVVASLFWNSYVGTITGTLSFVFIFFGFLSQLGDLFESKLKRLFNLKDSSNIIPGHGGVYDRIDSLLFIAPFYASFLNFYFQ